MRMASSRHLSQSQRKSDWFFFSATFRYRQLWKCKTIEITVFLLCGSVGCMLKLSLAYPNTLQDGGRTNLVCQMTTPQNLQHPDVLQVLINNTVYGFHFNTCQVCDLRLGSASILRCGFFPFQNKIFQIATPFNLGDFNIRGMFSKTYNQTSVGLRIYIFLHTPPLY